MQDKVQREIGRVIDLPGAGLPPSAAPPELDAFLAFQYPEESRLIGPIQRQQIIHCAAGEGVGKTHLGAAVAAQLVNGAAYWHWEVPKRTPVLFIDGEMPGKKLQERLKLYRWGEERETFKIVNAMNWAADQGLPHPNLADPRWHERILEWAENLEVMILDNVMSLVSVPGASMNSDEFWKPVNDFNLRARAAGKTVIWLDHVNADGRAFGTRTKTWAADLVFTLESPQDHEAGTGCAFTLAFTKTRGLHGRDVEPFELNLVTGLDGSQEWRHRFSVEAEIAECVDMLKSGMSRRQIAKELDCSLGKAQKLCTKAQKLID